MPTAIIPPQRCLPFSTRPLPTVKLAALRLPGTPAQRLVAMTKLAHARRARALVTEAATVLATAVPAFGKVAHDLRTTDCHPATACRVTFRTKHAVAYRALLEAAASLARTKRAGGFAMNQPEEEAAPTGQGGAGVPVQTSQTFTGSPGAMPGFASC